MQQSTPGGVGQDHVHYKALTKIFLLNVVLLPAASNKSHSNGCCDNCIVFFVVSVVVSIFLGNCIIMLFVVS